MTLGSKKENGKLIYQFNITEEELNAILTNSTTTLNMITGNCEYDIIHFQLKAKKVVKRLKK